MMTATTHDNLTADECVRALVYKDHLGEGWYAYGPTADDSLDAEGHIPASIFDTKEEAESHVRKCLEAAGRRPRESTIGMKNVLD